MLLCSIWTNSKKLFYNRRCITIQIPRLCNHPVVGWNLVNRARKGITKGFGHAFKVIQGFIGIPIIVFADCSNSSRKRHNGPCISKYFSIRSKRTFIFSCRLVTVDTCYKYPKWIGEFMGRTKSNLGFFGVSNACFHGGIHYPIMV